MAAARTEMDAAAARGRLLEKYALFVSLSATVRGELAALARVRRFRARDPIFRVGEAGRTLMAVVAGTVRISLPAAKGREFILVDLPAGELFGEIALVDAKSRSANAMALTNCELLVWQRRDFLPLLERTPALSVKLMEILCARIRRSDERMSDIALLDLPVRLAKTLLRYPKQSRGPARLSFPQRELAEMSGGTRENVNRCLRDWRERGIITLRKRGTIIVKPDALRKLANCA
jgi:CRP/FNR family transcriptional regulator, cyclic AMP receptor protein